MIRHTRGRIHVAGMGAMLLVLLTGTASPNLARASDSADGIDSAATEYAAFFSVDIETAKRDVALTDEAARLQNLLAEKFPSEFAGLWIEHNPDFALVVALTTERDTAVRAEAGKFLAPFVVTRVHQRSVSALESAVAGLRVPDVQYSASIDLRTNQVDVDVLAGDKARAETSLREGLNSGEARLDVVPSLPEPVADIYGGLNLDSCGGGLSGTSGWSVARLSTGQKGVLTAGHLDNCLKYSGVGTTYMNGATSGNTDGQWHMTTFNEVPKFKVAGGGTRVPTGQRSYSGIVVGQLVCKYGRTTGYGCGTVEAKDVDPDGLGPLYAVFVRVQNCPGPSIAQPGDSGGPVFSGTIAIGIITHQDGDLFCTWKMIFNSLTHSTGRLGIYVLLG